MRDRYCRRRFSKLGVELGELYDILIQFTPREKTGAQTQAQTQLTVQTMRGCLTTGWPSGGLTLAIEHKLDIK